MPQVKEVTDGTVRPAADQFAQQVCRDRQEISWQFAADVDDALSTVVLMHTASERLKR